MNINLARNVYEEKNKLNILSISIKMENIFNYIMTPVLKINSKNFNTIKNISHNLCESRWDNTDKQNIIFTENIKSFHFIKYFEYINQNIITIIKNNNTINNTINNNSYFNYYFYDDNNYIDCLFYNEDYNNNDNDNDNIYWCVLLMKKQTNVINIFDINKYNDICTALFNPNKLFD